MSRATGCCLGRITSFASIAQNTPSRVSAAQKVLAAVRRSWPWKGRVVTRARFPICKSNNNDEKDEKAGIGELRAAEILNTQWNCVSAPGLDMNMAAEISNTQWDCVFAWSCLNNIAKQLNEIEN